MVYGPIDRAVREISQSNGDLLSNDRVWMSIHEMGHIFQEGGEMFVIKNIFSRETLYELKDYSECLDRDNFSQMNGAEVTNHLMFATGAYEKGDIRGVGKAFALASTELCGEKVPGEDNDNIVQW